MKVKWPDGFRCPSCGGGAAYFVAQRRLFQCQACRHQTSVTVGKVCEFEFRCNNRFDLEASFPALLVAVVRTIPHSVRNLVAEACG